MILCHHDIFGDTTLLLGIHERCFAKKKVKSIHLFLKIDNKFIINKQRMHDSDFFTNEKSFQYQPIGLLLNEVSFNFGLVSW